MSQEGWESVDGKKQKITVIRLVPGMKTSTYHVYEPGNPNICLDEPWTHPTIILPCTFETFQRKTEEIPYEVQGSTEKGIIELLEVLVRDNKLIKEISVRPKNKEENKTIFYRNFTYDLNSSTVLPDNFKNFVFSTYMTIPSSSQGIFNKQIQAHLEELANGNSAIAYDLDTCINYMIKEAGM